MRRARVAGRRMTEHLADVGVAILNKLVRMSRSGREESDDRADHRPLGQADVLRLAWCYSLIVSVLADVRDCCLGRCCRARRFAFTPD